MAHHVHHNKGLVRRLNWSVRSLWRDKKGATGVIIAAAILPSLAATGAAVDLARAYLAKSRLAAATDSAALAGGRVYFSPTADRNAEIMRYFNANFNPSQLGITAPVTVQITPTTAPNPSLDQSLQQLTVQTSTAVPAYFMKIFGMATMPINAEAEITRQQSGLELVLALDNTGSMATTDAGGGKSRIQALREASTELVNILYGGTPANTANPNLRVGILPYSHSVNVGHFLEQENMIDIPAGMSEFVTRGKTDRTDSVYNDAAGWKGCIEERQTVNNLSYNPANLTIPDGAHDLQDIPPGVNGRQKWRPYYYPTFIQDGTAQNAYRAPAGYPNARLLDSGGWNETGTQTPSATWNNPSLSVGGNSPNRACHSEAILPSNSTTRETLLSYISSRMGTEGWTYSDLGMNWAIKILSPEAPIASPIPWNNAVMEKAIVLMTDGLITGGTDQLGGNRIGYTSYGTTQEKRVWPSINEGSWASSHEQRLAMLCAEAKAKGVRVYTVTLAFNASDYAAKRALYESCAIPGGHFNAPNGAQLSDAFRMIATDLSKLRLSK
jgi:Flp pilus assembly protein TadG